MRNPMKSLIGAVVGACCLAAPALAETPAAIVEDVQAKGDAPAKLPTLYGVAPLVQAKSGSTLVIERTDGKEPTISVPLKSETMVGGKFYDFAKAGKSLTPGGSYLAILGTKRYAFQVDL